MKISAKIISAISTAIFALAVVAFFGCVLFREPLVVLLGDEYFAGYLNLFTIPAGALLNLLGSLVAGVMMIFVAANKKIGIWADILVLVFIGGKAVIATLIGYIQPVMIAKLCGTGGAGAYSVFTSVTSLVTLFASVGMSALLVVCGMSIAYKVLARRKNQVEITSGESTETEPLQMS